MSIDWQDVPLLRKLGYEDGKEFSFVTQKIVIDKVQDDGND